jgi:hypothetical protein
MDSPTLLDSAAEEWLWSLEWATAEKPDQDWTAVIQCLRDAARGKFGESGKDHDCAAWADLIEGLVGRAPTSRDCPFAWPVRPLPTRD